jgi:hypothetical protein
MAESNSTSVTAALPFVVDLPDRERDSALKRSWWTTPAESDYGDACEVGARWAAQYVDWCAATRDRGALTCILVDMAPALIAAERDHQYSGYVVGFLNALERLACAGALAHGGAHRTADAIAAEHAELRAAGSAERRARRLIRRVARASKAAP